MFRLALMIFCVAFLVAASFTMGDEPTSKPATTKPTLRVTASGLTIIEIAEGHGDAVAAAGDTVSVHYIGKLKDGKKFDSSYDRGEPIKFGLGQHQVIPGWDEGIAGMKVDEQRRLIIPPELGYGDREVGPIPANSTLVFDVKLVGIEK